MRLPHKDFTLPWIPTKDDGISRMVRRARIEGWENRVKAFENDPSFYNAWHWVNEHPGFYYYHDGMDPLHEKYLVSSRGMSDGVEVAVGMPDSSTGKESHIWLEVFWTHPDMRQSNLRLHDYEVDASAETYEESVVVLAKNIHHRYGNDRVLIEELWKK